jgi:ADP-ribose pyrophosphatase YjhB (NUDIX family)
LLKNVTGSSPFRQTGWRRLRAKLFHLYFLMTRPMTLGVRGVVHDPASNSVLLIRHTYVPGWQFPGGGVERRETALEALRRELYEECNVSLTGEPVLLSFHYNWRSSPRDHVAVYLINAYAQDGPKLPDREIAEAAFFPLDRLPELTTPATLRRIGEIFGDEPVASDW